MQDTQLDVKLTAAIDDIIQPQKFIEKHYKEKTGRKSPKKSPNKAAVSAEHSPAPEFLF